MAIKKAEEEIFLKIDGVGDEQSSSKAQHLAVHCYKRYTLTNSIPHVRSLLFFYLRYQCAGVILQFKRFKLLRVLDLEKLHLHYLPEEIGEIGLLRFLCLRGNKIRNLPSAIGRLRNLLTLGICNLYQNVPMEAPDVLWKLENLRTLYMSDIECNVPLKIDTLRTLRSLSLIKFRHLIMNNSLE